MSNRSGNAYALPRDADHQPAMGGVNSTALSQVLPLEIDPNTGQLLVANGNIVIAGYDYMGVTYPSTTTEVYVYKIGGSSGVVVGTVTIVYTDSTKASVSTITRS